MFPTVMLDTPTQRKILRTLSEKNKMYTSEELADICHRSESSISRALNKADKTDFIKKRNLKEPRQKAYGLDSSSRYTSAIRKFFEIEKQQEREETVPLKIWNYLEDIISSTEDEDIIDILLFGSYAEGNYHHESDIDLLIIHKNSPEALENLKKTIDKHRYDKEVQVLNLEIKQTEDIKDQLYNKSPINEKDSYIPLIGGLEN